MTNWQAEWVWQRGQAWTVDHHAFFRKEFVVEGETERAILLISAYSDYTVWVNGALIGRGPEPNDPWWQTFDSYDIALYLTTGANVIAVLAHNYAIGTHWHNRNRGGLIAQVEITTATGTQIIATDATWRVKTADCYAPNAPRQFWSADFLETFDFGKFDADWITRGFDDSAWETPEVLGPAGTRPWARLIARDIPLLKETWIMPTAAEKNRFALPRIHTIGFGDLLKPGETGIVCAEGVFTSDDTREIILHLECEDAFKLFLNGTQIEEQNYSEFFASTRVWRGKDDYDQIHDGMGHRDFSVPATLPPGENRLLLAIDHGKRGWGFLLALREKGNHLPLDIPIEWNLTGPHPSSGLWDSLNNHVAAPFPSVASTPSNQYPTPALITDFATLMNYETRQDFAVFDLDSALTLKEGEGVILDMGRVMVGYPELSFMTKGDAILDLGYSQTLRNDRRITFSNGGRMKNVDRVVLTPGAHTYQPCQRKTLRYLHISCRAGENVTIYGVGVHAISYPVERIGAFECSDELLNRIYETSVYTTQILMQQGWQDCLKREQGTLNTSSFNYGGRGAYCAFGDGRLTRKNIRQALRTQNADGWFDSHGVSSPNSDEPTECLWLAVWLKDYLLHTGDTEFAAESFDALEDNLRYWNKGINRYGLLEGRYRPIYWRGQGIYLDDSYLYGKYSGHFDGELSGLNTLYVAAMQSAAEIAGAIGEKNRADYWSDRAERVTKSLNERFWNAERGLYRDWRNGDELGEDYHSIIQITAAYFGIGDPLQTDALARYLTDDLGLPDENRDDYPLFTFGYYFYFLEYLFRVGREAEAYTLLRRFYGRWLELGGTTFGEFFHMARFRGKTHLDEEYEVHAYGTSAHWHFYANILGVRPLTPGFAHIRIAPKPGDLTWAKGALATPHGKIEIAWRREGTAFTLEMTLPDEITPEIHWPNGVTECILQVNGREREIAN